MKKVACFLLFIWSSLLLSGCMPKSKIATITEEKPLPKGGETKMVNQKKVLMVLAPLDFQEREYQIPRTILENAGFRITVATKGATTAKASSGKTISVDQELTEVKTDEFEAIVFVGGPGTTIYFNDQTALSLAKEAYQKNKVIGAICIAPSILANAGILKDKKATCFSSEVENLQDKGATYTGDPVTVDGKIVTANGPSAAEEFGKKILETLEKS